VHYYRTLSSIHMCMEMSLVLRSQGDVFFHGVAAFHRGLATVQILDMSEWQTLVYRKEKLQVSHDKATTRQQYKMRSHHIIIAVFVFSLLSM
jgi:hypothetical protein